MFCLKCGGELKATDASCPKCSTPNIVPDLNDYMRYTRYLADLLKLREIYCPSCGKTVMKLTDKYCNSCYGLNPLMVFGDYLLGPSSHNVAALPESADAKSRSRRTSAVETNVSAGTSYGPLVDDAPEHKPPRGRRAEFESRQPRGSTPRERYTPPPPQRARTPPPR